MLSKKRFLAIKKLAKEVREANEDIFEKFTNEPLEKAIKDKDKFVSKIMEEINFSDGEQGKEEKQMFRAGVLIPDDDDFYTVYFEDKNIRSLMNRYAVSIEDIMSKITELNIYGKYFEECKNEEEPVTGDFVDEMVNMSFESAESLLNEISDLADSMEKELSITDNDTEEKTDISSVEEYENEENFEDISSVDDDDDVDFDSMSHAVNGFVEDYDRVKNDLNMAKDELEKAMENSSALMENIEKLKQENKELKQNNLDSANTIKETTEKYHNILNENAILKERNEKLEKKMRQSSELLRRIYDSIPKK